MNNLLARGLTVCILPETLKQIYCFYSAKEEHSEYETLQMVMMLLRW